MIHKYIILVMNDRRKKDLKKYYCLSRAEMESRFVWAVDMGYKRIVVEIKIE